MNILIVSFESEYLHKFAEAQWKAGDVVEEFQIPQILDEQYMIKMISWADQVYCQTMQEKKILCIMKVFAKKIKVIKL